MKTTVELPDDLMVAAKKRAAEARSTLRELVERGLRRELRGERRTRATPRRSICWVTVDGGVPSGLDLTDRVGMTEWLRRHE